MQLSQAHSSLNFVACACRLKLKNTEMECEHLRQCFDTLTQENRRLQREVEELRAMPLHSRRLFQHLRSLWCAPTRRAPLGSNAGGWPAHLAARTTEPQLSSPLWCVRHLGIWEEGYYKDSLMALIWGSDKSSCIKINEEWAWKY